MPVRAKLVVRLVGTLAAIVIVSAAQTAPDPLLDAVRRNDLATVRSLLMGRKDANTAQPDGLSALHLAAERGNVEIAKHLIDAGATVDAKTRVGAYTPLHLAAGAARSDMVGFLLFVGADVDAVTTTGGVTPLHVAAQALNGEAVVRELLRRGAPVDAPEAAGGQTPLMFAAAAGREAAARELLNGGAAPSVGTEETPALLERLGSEMKCLDRQVQGTVDDCPPP